MQRGTHVIDFRFLEEWTTSFVLLWWNKIWLFGTVTKAFRTRHRHLCKRVHDELQSLAVATMLEQCDVLFIVVQHKIYLHCPTWSRPRSDHCSTFSAH